LKEQGLSYLEVYKRMQGQTQKVLDPVWEHDKNVQLLAKYRKQAEKDMLKTTLLRQAALSEGSQGGARAAQPGPQAPRGPAAPGGKSDTKQKETPTFRGTDGAALHKDLAGVMCPVPGKGLFKNTDVERAPRVPANWKGDCMVCGSAHPMNECESGPVWHAGGREKRCSPRHLFKLGVVDKDGLLKKR
jgi:hypothetical protein